MKLILKRIRKFILYRGYSGIGLNTVIKKPMRITNKNSIKIGDFVRIREGVRLEVVTDWFNTKHNGKLVIGDNTIIEQRCHIVASKELKIGFDCVIAAGVLITDCNHDFQDIDRSVMMQPLITKSTTIGNRCFIGYNSVVLPGVIIGDNVIVGANTVVTTSVPSYSVVVGNPAKVIMKYDHETNEWVKIK